MSRIERASGLSAIVFFAIACGGTPENAVSGKTRAKDKGSGGSAGTSESAGGAGAGSAAQPGGGVSGKGRGGSAGRGLGGFGVSVGGSGVSVGGLPGVGLGGLPGVSLGGKAGSAGTAGHVGSAGASSSAGSGGATGDGPTVGGCAMFPPEDDWNQDISAEAVDTDWTTRLQKLVGGVKIHPDYGGDASALYGIPVGVVPADQPKLPVTFDWYPEESDPGPYPFPGPADAKIEGGDAMNCDGDCHLLVVQQGSCQLYEGYACHYDAGWHCGNGAHWDLTRVSYGQRQKGWTSADAAGLAIAPGILRYDEVRAGAVKHAIRFTLDCTKPDFVKPATHDAVPDGCADDDPNAPPMGLRVRLKADYDVSSLSASAQVVLDAMKRYGMILADNGSNFYFQGEANLGWTDDDIEPLKGVPASAFEVVSVPPLEN